MYLPVPAVEIQQRIEDLQLKLQLGGFDGALIVQNTDLYYFAGTNQQAHLFVPSEGAAFLMVRKYYPRAREESPLERVMSIKSLRELPETIVNSLSGMPRKLLMELDVLPAAMFRLYEKMFAGTEIIDGAHVIRGLRAVKSPWEIEQIERAGVVLEGVFAQVPELLREGMTELELSADIERLMRLRGHEGVARMRGFNAELGPGFVTAGSRGAMRSNFDGPVGGVGLSPNFPNGASCAKIAVGEPILVDLVAVVNGYCCDVTRLYCIGPLSDELQQALLLCLAVQEKVTSRLVPGANCMDLYHEVQEFIGDSAFKQNFMGPLDDKVSFIAHGIGLEVDEWPLLAARYPGELTIGNVLALEPKIILPQGAVGVENTWAVTPGGGRRLCKAQDVFVTER